jgi:hypothetical protein
MRRMAHTSRAGSGDHARVRAIRRWAPILTRCRRGQPLWLVLGGIGIKLSLARPRREGVETSRPAGMRRRATVALGAGAAVALLVGVGQPVGRPARADAAVKASFARLPLSFVVNRGQLDRRVSFAVQGRDASALFARRGVSYVLGGRHVVKVDFVGARAVEPVGQRRLAGIVSVFKGDRSQWRTGIPTFRGIVYRDLWPGIDLVWSGAQGRLKYTLVVRPGADPAAIKLRYRGAKLSVEDGGLVVRTPVRTLHEGGRLGVRRLPTRCAGRSSGSALPAMTARGRW